MGHSVLQKMLHEKVFQTQPSQGEEDDIIEVA